MLATLWSNLLGLPELPGGDDADFFLLGATSLQASLLISQIRQAFGANISLLTLYDNSSLVRLTSVIEEHRGGTFETVRNEQAIWLEDTKAADDLILPSGPVVDWRRDTEGRVFFTGATGFVGAFMLADLLRMSEVHQVGCLVRAVDKVSGFQRLRQAMTKYGQWEDQFADKLLVLCGTLEDLYLGLGPERFNEIANWASVIFHLGARVNYTQPYSIHRPANVDGTVNVLRLGCTGRLKAVHYVSSISCFGPTGFVTGAQSIVEDEPLSKHLEALTYDHGYAQSQWVVEAMLRRLIDRDFPIAVYRPGFITGHSKTGACNPDDFFSRLIHSCVEIGCYPLLPNQRKEFVPVDYVNSTILHIAASVSSLGHAYHIVPPNREVSIDMNDSMELVRSLVGDTIMEGIPYRKWVDILTDKAPSRLQPLQPMLAEKAHKGLSRWELYENMPSYDTTNTNQALESYPGGLEFPILDQRLMRRYITYLQTN